ncbi:MFS transporter [Rhodobacteraceae bacterium CYK-10]|uniref:MFS transporter n=2 Tax=Stagnihabitans tardus TaxID=2699202 RepID=A0AAE4YCR9_9RHOB|nr:MFS transporter [Stagnihabitans tardus]
MTAMTDLRLARAPLASFFAMGILWGSFAADLPDIKTTLGVDETRLGALLLMTPLAALIAMALSGRIARGLGTLALPLSTLAMALAFMVPGQVPIWYLFPLAMLFCGASTGAVDVLMNARIAALEAGGRSLMTLAHAAYSFGYAGGALGTGALRTLGLGPGGVLLTMGGVAALVALLCFEGQRIEGLTKGARVRLGLVPLIGGGIVLIAFLTENAAEYWSALHIEQTLGGSPAFGSAAPALLALTMGIARIAGHGLADRVGAGRLLTLGAGISACGAMIIATAPGAPVAYLGFVVMGLGSSVIAPTAFTLVGRLSPPQDRARAIQAATMLGYSGYFVGPPGLGLIAGTFGLRAAFVAAAMALCLTWVLVWTLARVRR